MRDYTNKHDQISFATVPNATILRHFRKDPRTRKSENPTTATINHNNLGPKIKDEILYINKKKPARGTKTTIEKNENTPPQPTKTNKNRLWRLSGWPIPTIVAPPVGVNCKMWLLYILAAALQTHHTPKRIDTGFNLLPGVNFIFISTLFVPDLRARIKTQKNTHTCAQKRARSSSTLFTEDKKRRRRKTTVKKGQTLTLSLIHISEPTRPY